MWKTDYLHTQERFFSIPSDREGAGGGKGRLVKEMFEVSFHKVLVRVNGWKKTIFVSTYNNLIWGIRTNQDYRDQFVTLHYLLEYLGSNLKDHCLHCQPMTDSCEFSFLVGADLLPSMDLKWASKLNNLLAGMLSHQQII